VTTTNPSLIFCFGEVLDINESPKHIGDTTNGGTCVEQAESSVFVVRYGLHYCNAITMLARKVFDFPGGRLHQPSNIIIQ
jgi:hypothetical protein